MKLESQAYRMGRNDANDNKLKQVNQTSTKAFN